MYTLTLFVFVCSPYILSVTFCVFNGSLKANKESLKNEAQEWEAAGGDGAELIGVEDYVPEIKSRPIGAPSSKWQELLLTYTYRLTVSVTNNSRIMANHSSGRSYPDGVFVAAPSLLR